MPYNKAMSVTNGKGQPTDLLAISKTKNNKNKLSMNWNSFSIKPYWSDNKSWFKAIHKQDKTPRTAKTIFLKETFLSFSENKKIHGIAKAIWMGLETKFGINPEKIKNIWKMIDPRPIIIHIFLSILINYDEKIFLRLFLCNILMHLGEF